MGDNKPISKSDLRSLFGSLLSGGGSSASSSRESNAIQPEVASGEDYRKSNQTLVIRNCQLKSEMAKVKKEMDSLRSENESLRERLRQMETATEDERIELIVSQRVESRVKQFRCIVDRSVKYLQKASDQMSGVFGEEEEEDENIIPTTAVAPVNERKSAAPLARRPTLPKVEESPLRRTTLPRDVASSSTSTSPDLPPMSAKDAPTTSTTVVAAAAAAQPRKGKSPLRIRPRTPKRDRQIRDSTPTPSSPPSHAFDGINDSTRRKRSATLKISSFKEPSLSGKLRRPAGFDPAKDYI